VGDRQRAANFWSAALGYAPHPRGSHLLIPPDGTGPRIVVDELDVTHLDLYTADKAEQETEIERLVGLGAQQVEDWEYPDDADFVVLRDTEGNLFCVIDHS
jgi:hypothetical protein